MLLQNILGHVPPPIDAVLSRVLLENVPNADLYLAITAVALTALAFVQLHAFTRPPPVPSKRLPRRPALQLNFKPDDFPSPAISSSVSSSSVAAGPRAMAAASPGSVFGLRGRALRAVAGVPPTPGVAGSLPSDILGSPLLRGVSGREDLVDDVTATTLTDSPSAEFPVLHSQDLPDSFAPLLSSSQMEVLHNQLTADLIHAVQVKGGVQLREGRHEIPLNKDISRPQFFFDVGKGGCRISATGTVGSDRFSSSEDLDVHKPTTSRSRPMVKDAGLVLEPPLALLNVAPTLIHFPTLFEDNVVPTLRQIQIVRFALDLVASLSSFLEKVLWIIESKCQIHLSRVRVMPLYKGASPQSNSPQWRLSLAFSGHILLFGWIPIPFVSFTLPTFIIPQPHALLSYLLTAQPLASARVRRENIAEQRILLAALDAADSWYVNVRAVATPPALGMDLTLPGGLTVALEMMHGKDLYAGARRQEGESPGSAQHTPPANIGMDREYSGETLSSWNTHPDSTSHLRARHHPSPFAQPPPTASMGSGNLPPKPFDANMLVPWFVELSAKGRIDKEKISFTVEKLSATHNAGTDDDNDGPISSQLSISGTLVVCKPDPGAAGSHGGASIPTAVLTPVRKKLSSSHLASLNSTADAPSVYAIMLYPDSSSSAPMSQRINHLLQYDYAFDIGEDTKLDAVTLSVGATHPMLKGGTIITTVLESIYAYGSLSAREGAIFDMRERRRKRNILRHLPAVDVTAGIANCFIPEQSMSYHDDGQTICFPELLGGRMMIRIVGGFYDNDGVGGVSTAKGSPEHVPGLEYCVEEEESLYVAEGIKLLVDFGVSSFALNNESKVNEFPEMNIFENSRLISLLSGTFSSRIAAHLRPQNLESSLSGTAPNVSNPLEAYEIAFSGSSGSLKIRESSATLGHRRIIIPTETMFVVRIVESVVDMAFEGKTECQMIWDFQGSSPILQVTPVGQSPANVTHENRDQVAILISDLRQGKLNFHVSDVGGISFKQAATSREHREGLYDWKFFNALVSPDEESPARIIKVLHDKRTMKKLLQVIKLINSDLERVLRHILTQVWRAKDIFDEEGVSDPGKIIPGHRMARLISLFLCGSISEVKEILPIIRRVTNGEGLDVVKVKELLHKHVAGYDTWAPEIDRAVRWVDVMLSPMVAPLPYMENEVPPLSELPCHSARFKNIPSAKDLYSTLVDKRQLPLDPSFSNLVGRIAPYLSFSQVEYCLKVRKPSDWQPSDLRRLRYVYSVKKKVLDISESYGGLSFLPQSFFVSVFVGEATRASLRSWDPPRKRQPDEGGISWHAVKTDRTSTLSTLRKRRTRIGHQSSFRETDKPSISIEQQSDDVFVSPASRVASQNNFRRIGSADNTELNEPSAVNPMNSFDLGDSLLGPQDVAILLQAGLTSSMKGSTVVQLNQRMLLDLMASQPRSFSVAVLAEIGTPGGQGCPRGLTSALMALLELDQSSFSRFHRLDMHALLESWLPGSKIPRREDYLAGGRWARQSYYEALYGVAKNILEDAESYMALKGHVQRLRHSTERDPLPLPKEKQSAIHDVGIDIDAAGPSMQSKLSHAIDTAKDKISAADQQGNIALSDLIECNKSAQEIESCRCAIRLYNDAFDACAEVLKLDKLAFQADWFKQFYRRNYDALMVKSVYDNVVNDVDRVRHWMDALMRGSREKEAKLKAAQDTTPPSSPGASGTNAVDPTTPLSAGDQEHGAKGTEGAFFAHPEEHSEQEIVDAIIDAMIYYENDREILKNDPLVRFLISNRPGKYDFTIITAMGVITEGKKGLELQSALERLEEERGVKTIRADTGTARSFEFNASKIEEAIELATQLQRPFGLLGYSQGCANVLTAESLMFSGTPLQQQTLTSSKCGLVCRQLLFSAANGSVHGTASDSKVQRLIVMCEEFFKYQQGYCSRAFISTVLELLNDLMDSAPFHKFTGGAQSFLPEGCRAFWREAQHLPHVPTTTLRGVLEEHTTPECLEMMSHLLTKQSGSALQDSQVHVYDAVGHPIYTKNRNGKILENCDMGGSVQRTHHWSPLSEEVEFVKTKRDEERASFDCAKDRHVFPWVDVNARFGIIKYAATMDVGKKNGEKK